MRTTLDLPDAVFRQLKDLVAELIQAGLQRPPGSSGPRPRSPLPVIRKPTRAIHPSQYNREIESILATEELDERKKTTNDLTGDQLGHDAGLLLPFHPKRQ